MIVEKQLGKISKKTGKPSSRNKVFLVKSENFKTGNLRVLAVCQSEREANDKDKVMKESKPWLF